MSDLPFSIFGIKAIHLVAGLAGGLARVLSRPDLSWTRRIGTGVVGALVAGYGSPLATAFAWAYLPAPIVGKVAYGELEGLAGFVLGLTGLTVADAAIRWARAWRDWLPKPPAG